MKMVNPHVGKFPVLVLVCSFLLKGPVAASDAIEIKSLMRIKRVTELPAHELIGLGAPEVVSSDAGTLSFLLDRRRGEGPASGEWLPAGVLMASVGDKDDSPALFVRLWARAPAKLRLEHSRLISEGKQSTVAQFLVGGERLQFTLTSDGALYAETSLIGQVK